MNRLSTEDRAAIIRCLCEGNSIRSTARITGAARNTITTLLVQLARACTEHQDRTLRNLRCSVIECDEIWAFCYAKAKNVPEEHRGQFGYGDVWTWVAICADTKLVPTWLVGMRDELDGEIFLRDLASRLAGRIQLTTDGHVVYRDAVERSFGSDVDYAQLIKEYGIEASEDGNSTARRYSPNTVTSQEVRIVNGTPDADRISTSYVERNNLTMRMGMRRFTRLTNAFSKKVENHAAAVALHYMFYNFARPHGSLGKNRTPAMAAGVSNHVWTCEEIAGLIED